jgi:hypothetical protein
MLVGASLVLFASLATAADPLMELRTGRAGHAFDHLGAIGEQAEAAAASGATIIYATGLGGAGVNGLPPAKELAELRRHAAEYNRHAKERGIKLSIGYLCATSIVKLDTYDANFPPELKAQLKTPPSEWLQQDRQGKPLPSWYGGDYRPACMNNPDWQTYETYMVRQQLETGHDGIFFDNPTVHPQGCCCEHCMKKFAAYLEENGVLADGTGNGREVEAIRKLADAHPKEFLRFRSNIASGFLARMREFARTIHPDALITCNNSLNSPGVLYSQCRTYGYNIHAMSQVEDFIVVEDQATQPRTEADGRMIEYGPTYKQLHAIDHGKPLVAVVIAGGDYHTPPNLMRLAMAEAAAHDASYLSWPTWPKEQRQRMSTAVRPQADLLRSEEELLNGARARADVLLFLPFRRWTETDQCTASSLAASLSQANVQYAVFSEDNFQLPTDGKPFPVLVVESRSVLNSKEAAAVQTFEQQGGRVVTGDHATWFNEVQQAVAQPSMVVKGPATVRAILRDQPDRTIVHLYNLNIARLSSFEDKVTPAEDVKLVISVPFANVGSGTSHTADATTTSGKLAFTTLDQSKASSRVELTLPRLEISTILEIHRAK